MPQEKDVSIEEHAKKLASQLMNIGEKTAVTLIRADIKTPEQLRQLGAKKAYLQILSKNLFCGVFHAAYLYALYGAIYNIPWQNIPEKKKKEFKSFTEALRSGGK